MESGSETVPIEAAVDEGKDTEFGTQRQHMYGEIFDDESVPALLDKLQYNLGSQLDDIQDCLEHLEDRIDDLEELERGRDPSLQGSPTGPISSLKAYKMHSAFGRVGPGPGAEKGKGEGGGDESKQNGEPSPMQSQVSTVGDMSPMMPRATIGRRGSVRGSQRMLARESSRFRSMQSNRVINESPHEF